MHQAVFKNHRRAAFWLDRSFELRETGGAALELVVQINHSRMRREGIVPEQARRVRMWRDIVAGTVAIGLDEAAHERVVLPAGLRASSPQAPRNALEERRRDQNRFLVAAPHRPKVGLAKARAVSA